MSIYKLGTKCLCSCCGSIYYRDHSGYLSPACEDCMRFEIPHIFRAVGDKEKIPQLIKHLKKCIEFWEE